MTLTITPREGGCLLREIQEHAVTVLYQWRGRGEVGGNNRGSFVMGLTHGRVGSWCSALQFAAEEEAAKRLQLVHPIPYSRKAHSARWLLKATAKLGRYVKPTEARVGDYVCFKRGLPWQGHAARVSRCLRPGLVMLIDGNVGAYSRTRGRVREYRCDLTTAKLVGVARY